MSSLFKKRKVITWVLLVVMIFQTLIMSLSRVNVFAEDANDRLSNYIKLAKGKNITDIDISQITNEELQILGVYLSNFYVPMSTAIGTSTSEDTAKKNMVNALVNGASFDKDMAEVLVQGIWDMTIQSAKPLYIGKIVDDKFTVEDVRTDKLQRGGKTDLMYGKSGGTPGAFEKGKDGNIHTVGSYFSFLDWFSGLNIVDNETGYEVNSGILKDQQICLFWIDDKGNKIPVFDTKYESSCAKFTPSSLTYAIINDNLNYNNGVGSALVDCTDIKTYNSLNDENKDKVTCTHARLYVDCFGNILCDYGINKYVLVPACANPYAWYTKEDKSDVGKNLNLINLFMLQEAEEEHLTGTYVKDEKDWRYKYMIYCGKQSLMNLYFWRITRDTTETSLDLNQGFWFTNIGCGEGGTLRDRLWNWVKEKDSTQEQRFLNWSVYDYDVQLNGGGKGDYRGYFEYDNQDKSKMLTWSAIDDFIFIDNLNTFKSSKDDDYSVFNLLNEGKGGIFKLKSEDEMTEDEKNSSEYDGLPLKDSGGLSYSGVTDTNQINIVKSGSAKCYLAGIYVSYALAYYNDFSKDDKGKNSYIVNYAYNKDSFPSPDGVSVDWSNVKISSEAMDNEIKSMIYYFLHPTEGISYVATWFKNKISGILVKWHEDMVGSSDGTSTTGSTKYLGFSGYVTLPTLSDIKWTAWLLDEYNNLVVYLIIIIFIILIAYCIVGSMTFQRAIFGTLLFGLLAFFPPLCINATINTINNACDRIYGGKFTYWALVQNQSYVDELNDAIANEDKDSYLIALFKDQNEQLDTNNYARVKLKWLSPKKIDVKADANESLNKFTSSPLLSNIMNGMLTQQLSGETYQDSEDALFLYRDYADLYGYMKSSYNTDEWYNDSLVGYEFKVDEKDFIAGGRDSTRKMYYNSTDKDGNKNSLYSVVSVRDDLTKEYSQAFAQASGFTVNTELDDIKNRSFTFLLDSDAGADVLSKNEELLSGDISKNITLDPTYFGSTNKDFSHKFGFGTDEFNVTLPKINGGIEDGADPNTGQPQKVWSSDKSIKFDKDKLGKYYFSLYTESPFYFFSWNIYDQQKSKEFSSSIGTSSEGLESMLLDMYTINNQQYFYNYNNNALNGYGEMRDFCNMRALFYHVIPYLREVNKGVLKWSDLYGTFTYDDVKVEYKDGVATNFPTKDDTDEYIYKWWHNWNVERLFNTYSPWVDLMYSCDYSKSETINVLGEKYQVVDPLDPTSYFTVDSNGDVVSGRMMVFSRSEMEYYGLTMNDLTQVEQKIIKIQDQVYEDLLQLMDYADFDNDVLVTSAGMLTTFAFNQEFSQTTPVGRSYTLYPQSYELKAFSYDAYLRLILAESTGEDLMNTENKNFSENQGQKSYYQRIVENSSITTGIGLIILDIIAVYAIPALKLFFLVAIFFMSVLMIVAAAVKLEMNIVKTTWDALVSPLLKFGAVSIGLAWVVSLFMSDGNTDVTHRGGLTISLGDPVMVILVMIVINVVVLILYYKICKKCFKQAVEFAKAIGTSMSGAIGGSLGKMAGLAIGGKAISDSVARGTAKARGKLNKPSATSTGVGGGSGKGSGKAGAFVAGAVAGKVADDVMDAKKKEKYDSLSKLQQSKVDKSNDKAKKAEEKYNKLSGNNDFDKATSYKDEADILRKQRNVAKLDREKHGRKATIGERAGDLKSYMTEKKLDLMSGIHSTKGSVRKGVNGKLGRTDRAMRKNIRSRQDASVRLSESTRRNKQNADYRAKRRRQDALHASRGKQKKKKGKK